MSVRDLANDILDLQLWVAFVLFVVCVFLGSFGAAAGRDLGRWVSRKLRRDDLRKIRADWEQWGDLLKRRAQRKGWE